MATQVVLIMFFNDTQVFKTFYNYCSCFFLTLGFDPALSHSLKLLLLSPTIFHQALVLPVSSDSFLAILFLQLLNSKLVFPELFEGPDILRASYKSFRMLCFRVRNYPVGILFHRSFFIFICCENTVQLQNKKTLQAIHGNFPMIR